MLLPPKLYFKFCCSLYHSDGWNLMRWYQILIWQIQMSFQYSNNVVTTTFTVVFNFNAISKFDSTSAAWWNFVLLVDFDLGSAMIERVWKLELGHYNAPGYCNMADDCSCASTSSLSRAINLLREATTLIANESTVLGSSSPSTMPRQPSTSSCSSEIPKF